MPSRRPRARALGPASPVLAALALTVSALLAPAAASAAPALSVEGYVLGSDAVAAYREDATRVDLLGVDGVTLAADGGAVTNVSAGASALLRAAHARGDDAELLVSNYANVLGDFDPERATRMLGSAAKRSAVAASLARTVSGSDWDGVQIDLEALRSTDRAGLVAFAAELRRRLPSGTEVSIAVSASTTAAGYRARGYDLAGVADAADRVVLMAYDQHGPWGAPGPVGSAAWARTATTALLAVVPAAKVDLGIAGYGYLWRKDGSGGRQVSDAAARRLAGDAARWDATAQEWTATLPNGRTLWWSDARSRRARERVASSLGLHGIAVWRLELADPLTR